MKYLETLIPIIDLIKTNPNACFLVPLKKSDFLNEKCKEKLKTEYMGNTYLCWLVTQIFCL